jgi:signal peptidase I
MQFDFAAVLVILALVTGGIWLLDLVVLAPRRARQFETGGHARSGRLDEQATKQPWLVDVSRSFFPVILIVLLLRSFLVEPFRIPSGSMEPTLLPGDFILVNKFSYGLRLPVLNTEIVDLGEPKRGDVVVFRYPEDPSIAYIKRIVGLPGDHVAYRNKQLYIDGDPVELAQLSLMNGETPPGHEQWLETLGTASHRILIRAGNYGESWERRVPQGHYFTLGDNRDNSRDSRYWGFLPEENLIGKAFLIWLNSNCITFNGYCDRIGRTIQ